MIINREILTQIKSKDGNTNLYDHMKKMNKVNVDLNDPKKFFDLFLNFGHLVFSEKFLLLHHQDFLLLYY